MRHYSRHSGRHRYNRCENRYRNLKDRIGAFTNSRGLYRSRRGIFMGVCRGLAEHFNFSVAWTRIIAFVLFLFTGFWPVGVMYIVGGLLLKVEPVSPLKTPKDQEFYDTYTHSRESAIQRIKRKFDNIERRIQRMEHTVTSKEFDFK